jgi:type I restriction enzyme S subunit
MYDPVGPDDWKESSVFDLAQWKNGLAFKNIDFSDRGWPVIKIAELKSGVSPQTARTMADYDPSVHVKAGDMLFSWSGNPDTSIDVFRWEGEDGWLNQHIFKVTAGQGLSDEFLFFLLKWLRPRFAEIARNKQTTGLGHVTIQDLKRMRVAVPNEREQAAIVQTIGPIQEKIDLNRRMNETLEAMARAIFKDWFVDFGPTRAKMEGRGPYLAADLWSLFPDRLDDDGKPDGWKEQPLDQIADFLNGIALQKYPANGEESLPVIKIAQLRAGTAASADRASTAIPPDYVVEDGDVLFSWSGSLLHRVWTGGHGALNQHLFKVTSKQFPKWFFFYWIAEHMPSFQATAASKATTMGHIQRHHLTQAATVVGTSAVMKAADELSAPLFDRQIANDLESRTLAATRDLLLPKLMSGEVRIREAEKIVGEVA